MCSVHTAGDVAMRRSVARHAARCCRAVLSGRVSGARGPAGRPADLPAPSLTVSYRSIQSTVVIGGSCTGGHGPLPLLNFYEQGAGQTAH